MLRAVTSHFAYLPFVFEAAPASWGVLKAVTHPIRTACSRKGVGIIRTEPPSPHHRSLPPMASEEQQALLSPDEIAASVTDWYVRHRRRPPPNCPWGFHLIRTAEKR